MKKWLLGFCLAGFIFSCDIRNEDKVAEMNNASSEFAGADSTTVQMVDSVFNFGKITDGEDVSFSYRFINSGNKPLIISSASASCGCTVPEKPEAPIQPGETGYLKVAFNSKGRVGPVHKEVHVVSNANPAMPRLQLVGEVIQAQ